MEKDTMIFLIQQLVSSDKSKTERLYALEDDVRDLKDELRKLKV